MSAHEMSDADDENAQASANDDSMVTGDVDTRGRHAVDFTGVSKAPALLPKGEYAATVVNAEVGVGTQSGEPHYKITFEIDPPDGTPTVRIDKYLTFHGKARDLAYQWASTLAGEPLPEGRIYLEDYLDRFFGAHCTVYVAPEEFQGRMRDSIRDIKPPKPPLSGGPLEPKKPGLF